MRQKTICWRILLVVGLTGMWASPAPALVKVAQSGFKFLSNPVAARGAGLGNAYMAMAEDATAIFWNPAGMALTERASVFFDYTKSIADINYFAGAVSWNSGDVGVFGLSAVMMDYGEFNGWRPDPLGGEPISTGTFSPSAFAMGLTYARSMTDRFAFGGTIKWARVDFGSSPRVVLVKDESGNTIGEDIEDIDHSLDLPVFDVGVMYYTHIKGIQFGAAFRNFSQEKSFIADEFSLPLELKIGAAADLIDVFSLHGLGANHAATFSSDFQHSRDFSSRMHYGVEYWYRGALALRSGYKSNYDQENFTFGAGLRGSLENYAVQFDYAFNDFGVFDPVHKFSIGLEF